MNEEMNEESRDGESPAVNPPGLKLVGADRLGLGKGTGLAELETGILQKRGRGADCRGPWTPLGAGFSSDRNWQPSDVSKLGGDRRTVLGKAYGTFLGCEGSFNTPAHWAAVS